MPRFPIESAFTSAEEGQRTPRLLAHVSCDLGCDGPACQHPRRLPRSINGLSRQVSEAFPGRDRERVVSRRQRTIEDETQGCVADLIRLGRDGPNLSR